MARKMQPNFGLREAVCNFCFSYDICRFKFLHFIQYVVCPIFIKYHLTKNIGGHSIIIRGHNFALFRPPPTSTWTNISLNVDRNRPFLDHLPPLLVHVVIERPQSGDKQRRRRSFFQKQIGVDFLLSNSF